MKSIALSAFIALAAVSADAQGVRLSSDFFPLAVGNKWTYTIALADGKKVADADMSVTDHRIIGGRSFYLLTDYPFVTDPAEKIRLIGYDRQEREFVRLLNEKEGPLFLGNGSSIKTLEQDGAGLPQKIQVRMDTLELTLQRGVGIVEARIETPAGVRIARISDARVGQGRASPNAAAPPPGPAPNPNAPTAVSATATVGSDNPRLVLETAAAATGVQITFTIGNTSDRLLPFRFASAQNFDLIITDTNGNEVWRWSRGQYFTSVVRSEALRPMGSWKYQAIWNRQDNEGKPVPSGEYRLVGRVTSTPPLDSGPISVTVP
jgi:hypothetical protein